MLSGATSRDRADQTEQAVLQRGVLGDLDLGPEHLDTRTEGARRPVLLHQLRRNRGRDRPQSFDVFGLHRVVLARGPGEVPAVEDQVVADDLVDLLLDRHAAVRRVALGAGELGIVEHGFDVGTCCLEGTERVVVHRRRRTGLAAHGSEHDAVHDDDVVDHVPGVPGFARRLVGPLIRAHGRDLASEGVGVAAVPVGDGAHDVGYSTIWVQRCSAIVRSVVSFVTVTSHTCVVRPR